MILAKTVPSIDAERVWTWPSAKTVLTKPGWPLLRNGELPSAVNWVAKLMLSPPPSKLASPQPGPSALSAALGAKAIPPVGSDEIPVVQSPVSSQSLTPLSQTCAEPMNMVKSGFGFAQLLARPPLKGLPGV